MVLGILVDNVAGRSSDLFLELVKDVSCVVTSSLALNVVYVASQKDTRATKTDHKKTFVWIIL